MKKKRNAMLAILGCLMLLSGCGEKNAQEIERKEVTESAVQQEITEPVQESASAQDIQGDLEQLEQIKTIQYAGDGRLLVYTDKLYLYDLAAGSILAEAENPADAPYISGIRVFVLDAGYAVVNEDYQAHMICSFYDKKLNYEKQIDLTADLQADVNFVREVAVGRSGTELAVCENGGISLYHTDTGEKKEVLRIADISYEATDGLCSVTQVDFTADGQTLIFLGQQFSLPVRDGAMAHTAAGSIHIDGSDLAVFGVEQMDIMHGFSSHAIYSQELPDDPAGEILVYLPDEKKLFPIALTEKGESSHAWPSDNGNFVATALCVEKKGWTIRLYETKTGRLLDEAFYECENTENYRSPWLYYMEEQEFLLGFWRPYGDHTQAMAAVISPD